MKQGSCSKCHQIRYICNVKYGMCVKCNRERLEDRRKETNDRMGETATLVEIAPNRVRRPILKKYKNTGQMEVFKIILLERGAKSQISGEFISQPTPINFMHLLAKGQNKYPRFILRKDNIVIATASEHHQFDNSSHEELRKKEKWKWVFAKIEQLKEEYKKLPKK